MHIFVPCTVNQDESNKYEEESGVSLWCFALLAMIGGWVYIPELRCRMLAEFDDIFSLVRRRRGRWRGSMQESLASVMGLIVWQM